MQKKRGKAVIIVIIIIVVAVGFFVWRSMAKPRGAQGGAITVQTEELSVQDIDLRVSASGTIQARDEESVFVNSTQKVSRVNVEVGDAVREGDILVEYDIEDSLENLQKQLEQAELNLRNAELSLDAIVLPLSTTEVLQYENSIKASDNSVYNAKSDLESTQNTIDRQQRTVNDNKTAMDDYKVLMDAKEVFSGLTLVNNDSVRFAKTLKDSKTLADEYTALFNAGGDGSGITFTNADVEKLAKTISDNKEAADKYIALQLVGGASQDEVNARTKAYEDSLTTLKTGYENAVESYSDNLRTLKTEYDNRVKAYDDSVKSLDDLRRQLVTKENTLNTAMMSQEEAKTKYNTARNKLSDESTLLKYDQQANQIELQRININDINRQIADLVSKTETPYSGVVLSVNAKDGSNVAGGSAVATIADLSLLKVVANVSEFDSPKVELGQKVFITSDGLGETAYEGVVSKIAPTATVVGGETVVQVEIDVENGDTKLKPGYTVDVEIVVMDKQDVLALPISALQHIPGIDKKLVYLVNAENIVSVAEVETGVTGEMYTESISGLKEGDKVVLNPPMGLREGSIVTEGMPGMTGIQGMTGNPGMMRSGGFNGGGETVYIETVGGGN